MDIRSDQTRGHSRRPGAGQGHARERRGPPAGTRWRAGRAYRLRPRPPGRRWTSDLIKLGVIAGDPGLDKDTLASVEALQRAHGGVLGEHTGSVLGLLAGDGPLAGGPRGRVRRPGQRSAAASGPGEVTFVQPRVHLSFRTSGS